MKLEHCWELELSFDFPEMQISDVLHLVDMTSYNVSFYISQTNDLLS